MSRLSLTSCAVAWQLFCLAGTEPALASPGNAGPSNAAIQPGELQAHEQSREFFDRGVRLFQDGHVEGALAEFEAAYRIHPNSAALQNIALCQKALFRYREAKSTLNTLLALHESELTPTDIKTARSVIGELTGLIGKVRIAVVPSTAEVSIDDAVVSAKDLEVPIEMDVGAHRLRVEAEGYETLQKTLSVTGGTGNPQVSVHLKATHGFLRVLTPNDNSAIAVDGHAVAFESYRGMVLPGRHVIQIYRSGFEPYEAVVELEAGQSVTVRGKVGDPVTDDDDDELTPKAPVGRPSSTPRQLRGWYGLLDLSLLNWIGAPEYIDPTGHRHLGYGYGLHAGYRLYTPIGVEAVIAVTHHEVTGSCENSAPDSNCVTENYELDTRRAGGALRLMSGGESIRFTSSIGIGAVSHDLRIFRMQPKGFDAYFSLEAGAQFNIHHALFELVGFGWFESAGSIKSGTYAPYQAGNGIQMFGLAMRVGWSEWTPRDAR